MSFIADPSALRRKRTATERAESNGDPLVIKKKAREAIKSNVDPTPAVTATKAVPAPKKGSNLNVSSYYFWIVKKHLTIFKQPSNLQHRSSVHSRG
jgi:hypothetical protein